MAIRSDFEPGEFCWVDLSTNNLKSAAAWYGELFGWSHHMMETPGGGPPYAFFMQGEAAIGGLAEIDEELKSAGVPPMWNSYVASADCAATEAKVKQLGGVVNVPTMEVPGHGKLAFFLDPEGASFAAWEASGDGGPGLLVGEPNGPCWNELKTRQSAKASKFYGSLFGWKFESVPMGDSDYSMVKVGDKRAGGISSMDEPQLEGMPAHWLLYIAVKDCKATVSKVKATGGKLVVPPTKIPVGTFSVISDPEGAMLAVIELANTERD